MTARKRQRRQRRKDSRAPAKPRPREEQEAAARLPRAARLTLLAVAVALILLTDDRHVGMVADGRQMINTAVAVAELCGPDPTPSAVATMLSVQEALSALDRLEVRGRDSAGLHVLVRDHAVATDEQPVAGVEVVFVLGAQLPLVGSSAPRGGR